jgi:LPXTG-motif cell wall-anchored protein
MHASSRRQRHGAFALALIGIFSLLAAFVPGVAGAAAVDPVEESFPGGEPVCATGLTGFRINDPGTGSYDSGDFEVDITVNDTADGPTIDFAITSDHLALKVFVKGGTNQNVYTYPAPGVSADSGLHSPVNDNNGKYFGLSHIDFCFEAGDEPGTFEVIPDKEWVGTVPAGATATLAVQVEGVTVKSFTFDSEGNLIGGGVDLDPVELEEGTVYTIVETNVVSPAGWECAEVEVAEPAADTIYNECEADDTPPPPPPPPVVTDNPPPPGTPTPELTPEAEVGGIGEETQSAGDELAQAAAAPQTLPRTGATSLPLAAGGALSLLSGLGLARMSRRED